MTIGAFAAVFKDDRILLVKPPDWVSQFSGHWNFPGGGVEENESLEKAAAREVYEETGIRCEVGSLIDTAYDPEFDISITVFKARYVSGNIKLQEEELIDAKWFTVEEALGLPLAFDVKRIIEKL